MSQLFSWGGQSIGVSALASVLPMNIQYWFPLEWTGLISWQSKELSRDFSNTAFHFFLFKIYFNWRLITLQYCGGFCHTFTWISHGLHVFSILTSNTTFQKHQFFGTQLSVWSNLVYVYFTLPVPRMSPLWDHRLLLCTLLYASTWHVLCHSIDTHWINEFSCSGKFMEPTLTVLPLRTREKRTKYKNNIWRHQDLWRQWGIPKPDLERKKAQRSK